MFHGGGGALGVSCGERRGEIELFKQGTRTHTLAPSPSVLHARTASGTRAQHNGDGAQTTRHKGAPTSRQLWASPLTSIARARASANFFLLVCVVVAGLIRARRRRRHHDAGGVFTLANWTSARARCNWPHAQKVRRALSIALKKFPKRRPSPQPLYSRAHARARLVRVLREKKMAAHATLVMVMVVMVAACGHRVELHEPPPSPPPITTITNTLEARARD